MAKKNEEMKSDSEDIKAILGGKVRIKGLSRCYEENDGYVKEFSE